MLLSVSNDGATPARSLQGIAVHSQQRIAKQQNHNRLLNIIISFLVTLTIDEGRERDWNDGRG